MKKIIAIGGSNSEKSMNKELALYTANQIDNSVTQLVDLNEFELPLYGIDLENKQGIPANAIKMNELLEQADGIVVSIAEHNGSYTAAFKNAIDWLSRIDQKVWKEKPMFLMATSPGARGGVTVLESAKATFPYLGGKVVGDFSLPTFYDNFTPNGLKNDQLNEILNQKIKKFKAAI